MPRPLIDVRDPLSRRRFLRGAGLVGAGAVLLSACDSMRRFVVLSAAFAAALVCASVAWARPAAAPGSLPGAYHQSCLPDGTVRVTFGWTPSYGRAQWLDLSLADNEFAPATYVSAGPLAASTGSTVWDGLMPDRLHVARVNTLTVLGWEPSPTSRFVTRTCSTSSAARLASVSPEQCEAMTFQWAPANPEGQVQWIDLSTTGNGFAPETYARAGPFSRGVSSFYWTGLRQATRHYWRVNTWTGSQWISSATGSFSTPATPPATSGEAERVLGAAVRTMKGSDLPVFVKEAVDPQIFGYPSDRAIALGGKAYVGTYDGCFNQIIVVEAPGGDGSLMRLDESMTELPATWSQAQAQLKQLFPGAGPALGGDYSHAGANGAYVFQHEGATTSYSVWASRNNSVVMALAIVGSGSYKDLVPFCC